MRFQSTLLSTKNTTNSGLQSMVESTRPNIYDMLEYNSDIQDIDLKHKIIQYRNMVEAVYANDNNQSISVYNENIIVDGINKLIEMIKKLIEFIKNSIKNLFGGFKKKAQNAKDTVQQAENAPKNAFDWDRVCKFKVFCYPDITKIDSSKIVGGLKGLLDPLNMLAEGSNRDGADEVVLRTTYKSIFRLLNKNIKSSRPPVNKYEGKVEDGKSLREFTKQELCFVVYEEMTFRDWYNKFKNDTSEALKLGSKYADEQGIFIRQLKAAETTLENAKRKSLSSDVVAKMTTTVGYIKDVVDSYVALIATIEKYHSSYLNYGTEIINSMKRGVMNDYSNHKDYTNESGMIHGEPFNSDTLFDNEDPRDFNKTEWLDLNLAVECFAMKHELTEIRKRIVIKEACILADEEPNKISRLNAMREAEEKKSTSVVMSIINKIKEIFSKFTQAFNERFSTINLYIRHNKEIIDKPITIQSMKSGGDIVAGMYRCQNNINVIPFDYNAMKADLVDKKTFFKNKILPTLGKNNQTSKRKLDWTDDMDVATYCKIYFGASMPEDKYPACAYTGNELEQNKKNIVRFLTEKNISFSAKKDLDNLERESKRMAPVVSNNTSAGGAAKPAEGIGGGSSSGSTTGSGEGTSSKTESMYYSELYDRWITEADIDVGVSKEGDKPASTPNNDTYNAYRVYMEAYKDVILAKMTACEFITSEFKQLISMHVASNGGQKISDNKENDKK